MRNELVIATACNDSGTQHTVQVCATSPGCNLFVFETSQNTRGNLSATTLTGEQTAQLILKLYGSLGSEAAQALRDEAKKNQP